MDSIRPTHASGAQVTPRHVIHRAALVALVVVALSIAGGVAYYEFLISPRPGAGSLYAYNTTLVTPGSRGCNDIANEVCYSITMGTTFTNLQLSDVHFAVTKNGSISPSGPAQPLGAGATVTVLYSGDSIVGVWNWSSQNWTTGSVWTVPANMGVTLVFDSGLTNATVLTNERFWVWLSGPESGAAGSDLF